MVSEMMMKALMLAAALIGAAPAAAQTETNGVEVKIVDLDLASAEDVAKLDRRLGIAVRRVCGVPSERSLAAHEAVTACRIEAAARLAPQRDIAIAEARRADRRRLALAARR
jgi:UrcA family protein